MTPRYRLLLAGAILVGLALFLLMLLSVMYYPLQPVVQVVAPFIGLSVFASAGISLILIALLGPRGSLGRGGDTVGMSAVEKLLSDSERRRY